MTEILVSGNFDNLRARDFRFLDEASRLGPLHVLLWSDALCERLLGQQPKFPAAERAYLLEAIRYVSQVTQVDDLPGPHALPALPAGDAERTWVVDEAADAPEKRAFCAANGLGYTVLPEAQLAGFPLRPASPSPEPGRKKVIVTGCYDWLHSGHVRFFEECAQLGDLYVAVGNDANVRFLKGEGHPMFSQDERRYLVHSIRHVTEALVTSGMGWMDAAPEIDRLRPEIYAVNEDGDKPEKRAFCAEHNLQFVVLKRLPKEGLPRRESTQLRGF